MTPVDPVDVDALRALLDENEGAGTVPIGAGNLRALLQWLVDTTTALERANEELVGAATTWQIITESYARSNAALRVAREELERWGWGDMHYGSRPQERSVVHAIAVVDAALAAVAPAPATPPVERPWQPGWADAFPVAAAPPTEPPCICGPERYGPGHVAGCRWNAARIKADRPVAPLPAAGPEETTDDVR